MDILGGIKKAFRMMPEIVSSIGALVLTVVVLAMVVGVFVYQVITAGNVQVDGTWNATAGTGTGTAALIAQQSANFSSVIGNIWTAVNSVAGFIVIGVIALIAFSVLGKRFMGGGGKL